MNWTIIAIVAIVVWGVVQLSKARAGIISDEDGNETYIGPVNGRGEDGAARAELEATRREMEQLKERLHVLERIATDNNTMDARERARIAAEIEALRDPGEPTLQPSQPKAIESSKEEKSQ